jgi:hypothetical protein
MKIDYTSGTIITGKKFEFYSMISLADNPITDVLPLPFGKEVIESYEIMLNRLNKMIQYIVINKLDCIKRGVAGIIPEIKADSEISPEDISVINKIRDGFMDSHPEMEFPNPIEELSFKPLLGKMEWYTHLDENIFMWKNFPSDQ